MQIKKWVLSLMLVAFSTVIVFAAGDRENTYSEGWLSACACDSSLTTTCTHRLDMTVNQPLVAITWKGDLQPLLAESWDMQEGGKVWILHLRKGVKWHDGEPFTAKDAVFSFNAYANPKVGSRWSTKVADILGYDEFQSGTADSLVGVQALDDKTVRFELKDAIPLWLKLKQTYIPIFPEHILGDVAPEKLVSDPYWSHRIGTGPFKWVKYVDGQYIELERNESYFLGAPTIEHLIYRFYSEAATQAAALENGEIDTTAYETTIITLDDVARLDAVHNIDIFVMSKGMPNFIRVNHERPEWGDVRVRQAIRYAIDVDGILESLSHGYGQAAYTVFPQEWAIPEGLNKYEYNPEKAKQLLKEAGWDPNRKVDLVYHYGDLYTRNLLLAIQQNLAQVGMKVELRYTDAATIHAMQATGEMDAGYFGFGMGLDPSLGENTMRTGTVESAGYSNPAVDLLFAEGFKLSDRKDRQPFYYAIARIANQEQPCIWLWYVMRAVGFNRRVVGPYEHYSEEKIIYFNMPVYNEIENWYIK